MTHAIEIGPYEEDIAPAHARFTCDEQAGARCRVWCDFGCAAESDHGDECRLRDQGYCGWIEGWFDDAWAWEECYEGDGRPIRSGAIDFHHHGEDGPTWFYVEPAPSDMNGVDR